MVHEGYDFNDIVDDEPVETKEDKVSKQLKLLAEAGFNVGKNKDDDDGSGGSGGAGGEPEREYTWDESHRNDEPDFP